MRKQSKHQVRDNWEALCCFDKWFVLSRDIAMDTLALCFVV